MTRLAEHPARRDGGPYPKCATLANIEGDPLTAPRQSRTDNSSARDIRPMTRLRLQTWLAALAIFAMGVGGGLGLAARSHASGDLIERVNQRVNQRLTYRATNNSYDWIAYAEAGDCKTYVALKRQTLIREGVKPERLTIWQGQDEKGDLHAVLVVDDRRVLDNRFAWTVSLDDLRDFGGRARGYHMQRCFWCEQMARWLSPLPEDRDAPLPDFGYAAQLQALRGSLLVARSAPSQLANR